MKIMIDMLHPAHVHFFKYFIKNMINNGHEILVTSRSKEITNYLLDIYNIDHVCISSIGKTKVSLVKELFLRGLKFIQIAKHFDPDLLLGIMGATIAYAGKVLNVPSYVFYDSEVATPTNMYVYPMATKIITPNSYRKDLGKKQIRYDGFQETAYLHPNHFRPDPSILKSLGVNQSERFFILRFVSWQASHDYIDHGFSFEDIRKLIGILEKYGKVFITSEKPLTKDLEKYKIKIKPERIHDALFYATLFVGDSQTMSTEAAILGTPTVRCNTFVGPKDMGNFIDLEKKYDLLYSVQNVDSVIAKIRSLLDENINLKKIWSEKRDRLLHDKIDVTQYMVDLIENESYKWK